MFAYQFARSPGDFYSGDYGDFRTGGYNRSRYLEFLRLDFPRVAVTSDLDLLRRLCSLGSELIALHLLEPPAVLSPFTRYPIAGDNRVEKGYPKYIAPDEAEPGTGKSVDQGRVYINKTQYFEGVSPQVWEAQIGGYQVCERWLKDRRGRHLSYDDLSHYQKAVVAISETTRLMGEIDEAIPAWPLP